MLKAKDTNISVLILTLNSNNNLKSAPPVEDQYDSCIELYGK